MSMKKILFASAVAVIVGMTVTGCSQNEVLAEQATSESNVIGFHIVGSNPTTPKVQTRATPINSNNFTSTNFDVFAITESGKNFMGFPNATDGTTFNHDGVKIQHDGTNWVYATLSEQAYWPAEALNFYAISPAEGTDDNLNWLIKTDDQKFSYSIMDEFNTEITADGMKNADVMYAIAKNQTKTTTDGKVTMQFKHALSQVLFKARIAENQPKLKVEINSVKVDCFNSAGTFTFPTAEQTEGTWALGMPYIKNGYLAYPSSQDVKTVTGSDAEAVWLSDQANSMVMIPQTLIAWDVKGDTKTIEAAKEEKQSYLAIECRIYQNDALLDGFIADSWTTVYVPFGTTLEMGKRHIFTLVFGGGYDVEGNEILTPIVIEGQAEDWVDETNGDVNL